ncbi:MAG: putative transcriptional regulator [Bacillota bacterium]|jgi:DNA-binding PadR family transcriptional regulator|nr:putative transcriptional regulator [Bacillota bacterium]
MSIQYAILGLLSWKPSTGYDLKKIFEDSPYLYWSGNNNQIYKSLLQLQKDDLISGETIHQDGAPSKKVYSLTKKGLIALKTWILSGTEAPEVKKPFLIQMAWSDLLSNEELEQLLSDYEKTIEVQLTLQKEKYDREKDWPNRSQRETFLWNMVAVNLMSTFQNELDWVRKVRKQLQRFNVE